MNELRFDGRVAIVTGAGNGLGRSHALLLAQRGAHVVVNDAGGSVRGDGGDGGPAERVSDEIEALGGVAIANSESVSTPEGGAAIVEAAIDAFGRIDIVVNNAGILRDKTFHNLSADDVDAVLDVHLKGAFNVTRPAWLHMRDQGYGRIVNTTSSSGLLGNFGQANYGAAKMGLVGLTRVLAIEGARRGITVNAIAPVARTRMTEEILREHIDRLSPDLVSPVVCWLSHESCSTTGETFGVAGGRVTRFFVGQTQGIVRADLSIEDVRDHFDTIRDTADFTEHESVESEFAQLFGIFEQS